MLLYAILLWLLAQDPHITDCAYHVLNATVHATRDAWVDAC